MWISKLRLRNIRGFKDSNDINFSKNINILIGPNNAGKSTILKAIYLIQNNNSLSAEDISLSEGVGKVEVSFEEPLDSLHMNSGLKLNQHNKIIEIFLKRATPQMTGRYFKGMGAKSPFQDPDKNPNSTIFPGLPTLEPNHLIYPHLAKRKAANFQEAITSQTTRNIVDDYSLLYPKIDKLITGLPATREKFFKICENILQIPISTAAITQAGKVAVLPVTDNLYVSITAMGEGVVSLLGLIVDLCVAKNHVFIIEEPENDIHPTALKALLELIEEKSEDNQFFISTHSNIVLRYLGGNRNTVTHSLKMELKNNMPSSSIKKVETSEERWEALEVLGYEPIDFGFWNGWLFLEESTAEEIIRDFLIPVFCPALVTQIRTIATQGVGKLKDRFDIFNKHFIFFHLESRYKNKVWTIVDDGVDEKEIINKMKDTYTKHGWNAENFIQLTKHSFEEYYPIRFKNEIDAVLSDRGNNKLKIALLRKVKEFIANDRVTAITEFEQSAKEVIDILKVIESKISVV